MGRPPRIHFPGATYHVLARGNRRERIFLEERDWHRFLGLLEEIKTQCPFLLYAYCLMPNHFHLALRVIQAPLENIMHRLVGRYSQWFNWRRGQVGHVFQSRHKPILCGDDSYLKELIRYIHLNPVRAGLVGDPAQWLWSGHRELLSMVPPRLVDHSFPLSCFDEPARENYLRFVEAGKGLGREPKFYQPPQAAAPAPKPKELDFDAPGLSLEELAEVIGRGAGLSPDALRGSGRRPEVRAFRRQLALRAIAQGARMCEIAAFMGRDLSAVSRLIGGKRN